MLKEVWILWSVSEVKTFEIIRVYKDMERGSSDMQMLQSCGNKSKRYFLDLHKVQE